MQKRRADADFNAEDNPKESHVGLKDAYSAYLKTKGASWPEKGTIPEQAVSGSIEEAPGGQQHTNPSFLASTVVTHSYFTLNRVTESVH